MLEKQIEKKVADYAKTKGYRSDKFNSKSRGVPDRLFISSCGAILFIEFKKLNAKPTKKQMLVINDFLKRGCLVFVVDNVERGKEIIDKYKE